MLCSPKSVIIHLQIRQETALFSLKVSTFEVYYANKNLLHCLITVTYIYTNMRILVIYWFGRIKIVAAWWSILNHMKYSLYSFFRWSECFQALAIGFFSFRIKIAMFIVIQVIDLFLVYLYILPGIDIADMRTESRTRAVVFFFFTKKNCQ